jgi:hypothetical protein
VLLGAGLTVRPVIKRLDPVRLSCDGDCVTLIHPVSILARPEGRALRPLVVHEHLALHVST